MAEGGSAPAYDAPGNVERDVTIPEAVAYAVKLHRAGELREAEDIYRRILERAPDDVDALHFYGLLAYAAGRYLEGMDLVRRAIARDPGQAGIHANYGNINLQLRRFSVAIEAYEAAIQLDPASEAYRDNLATVHRLLGQLRAEEDRHRAAIDRDASDAKAWVSLGDSLERQGRFKEAVAAKVKALELRPGEADACFALVARYAAIGETARAAALLHDSMERRPDNPSLRHLLASISGADVPHRASDEYVASVFDGFAARFDDGLAELGYAAPALIGRAVADIYGPPEGSLRVLDAGCGTGLCGPHLRPYAQHLAGVDLSAGMLEKASARGGYDDLACEELTAFLLARPGAYDLIACADTLCYFGALDAVLAAMAASLRPGGVLAFTVERHDDGGVDVRLNANGRYSHSGDHVSGALAASGLSGLAGRGVDLRLELGEPVRGFLVTARRP